MAISAFRIISTVIVAGPSLIGMSFGAWLYLVPASDAEKQALGGLAHASPELQAMALQQMRMAQALKIAGDLTGNDFVGAQTATPSSNIIAASKPDTGFFGNMMNQVSSNMNSFGFGTETTEPVASRPGPGAKFVSVSDD